MKTWTYEKSGVPHLKGDPAYNRKIVRIISSTRVPGVMGSATGFAALFDFKKAGLRDPLLVASTDGVGTKLEVAALQGRHDTIGIDLVAMCVNDIITCGARPLFFLDYFASGRFDAGAAQDILSGIADGCRQAGCALIGGETAIMPGFYRAEGPDGKPQYDLAGFSVGVVERKGVIDGSRIKAGHILLGLASTGFHSNGYSLLRKLFNRRELSGAAGKRLLTPTRIYVKPVLAVMKEVPLTGIVNITGGGFVDNLPRVIPDGLCAEVRRGSWPVPEIFHEVARRGRIDESEMARTFNLGIGTILILPESGEARARRTLKRFNIDAWVMGRMRPSSGPGKVKILHEGNARRKR
jgi:phosphoribosylformylglycinamidine cyclo-ligase